MGDEIEGCLDRKAENSAPEPGAALPQWVQMQYQQQQQQKQPVKRQQQQQKQQHLVTEQLQTSIGSRNSINSSSIKGRRQQQQHYRSTLQQRIRRRGGVLKIRLSHSGKYVVLTAEGNYSRVKFPLFFYYSLRSFSLIVLTLFFYCKYFSF